MWRSEGNHVELVLFFFFFYLHMNSGDQTQAARLGCKHLYSLNRFPSPACCSVGSMHL